MMLDELDAALFAGTASVVWNRGDIFDGGDFEADGLQGADGGFAAGTGTLDSDFNLSHAVRHGLASGVLGDLLGGKSGALARAFKADLAGGGPSQQVAMHVG